MERAAGAPRLLFLHFARAGAKTSVELSDLGAKTLEEL